jgi:hypothetical protein
VKTLYSLLNSNNDHMYCYVDFWCTIHFHFFLHVTVFMLFKSETQRSIYLLLLITNIFNVVLDDYIV